MTIKVLFVDDHEMVRIGISSYLSTQSDIEVVGEGSSGKEAIEKAHTLNPDLILMDLLSTTRTYLVGPTKSACEIRWLPLHVVVRQSF